MGVCIEERKTYMITEFIEWGSLFDHLHKKKLQIPNERLIEICEDIALGMCYLHDRDVLHCDLKSSNILIDSGWNLKLCDFGLSAIYQDETRLKQYCGTYGYMAPE